MAFRDMSNDQICHLWGQMIKVHEYELLDNNLTWHEEEDYFFSKMTLFCAGINTEELWREALGAIKERLEKGN